MDSDLKAIGGWGWGQGPTQKLELVTEEMAGSVWALKALSSYWMHGCKPAHRWPTTWNKSITIFLVSMWTHQAHICQDVVKDKLCVLRSTNMPSISTSLNGHNICSTEALYPATGGSGKGGGGVKQCGQLIPSSTGRHHHCLCAPVTLTTLPSFQYTAIFKGLSLKGFLNNSMIFKDIQIANKHKKR